MFTDSWPYSDVGIYIRHSESTEEPTNPFDIKTELISPADGR